MGGLFFAECGQSRPSARGPKPDKALAQNSSLQGRVYVYGEYAWRCLLRSRLLERNVRIGAQCKRLPFPVEAIVASCLPLKLSADRKFPYDAFALAFAASASD